MMFERVRAAAVAALRAQDELLQAFREYKRDPGGSQPSREDARILRELVYRRVYPVTAFDVLVRLNHEAAVEVLLSRYLGIGVDPDRGFGGFVFDLSAMLSDIVELWGEESLLSLMHHPQLNSGIKDDPRFLVCLGHALDLDESGVTEWLTRVDKVRDNTVIPDG